MTSASSTTQPLQILYDFISELLVRRRKLLGNQDEDQTLVYGEALLRNALLRPGLESGSKNFPVQIAVIGPTQVGKSTVVNLLLGSEMAEVSGLAGFTRHIQGFYNGEITSRLTTATDILLAGLQRVDIETLDPDTPGCYSLVSVPEKSSLISEPNIIWDSPDFDSTSSRSYRSLVPTLCAMADFIVLVVSKEKYGDLTVWRTLHLLTAIDKPLLICINKGAKDECDELQSIVEKKCLHENISFTAVSTIAYTSDPGFSTLLASDDVINLRKKCADILRHLERETERVALKNYFLHHWPDWTDELRRENKYVAAWQAKVRACINESETLYQQEYLRNPHYRETLQRTVVRLLELLEIPGAAALLARTRQILTWPARTLLGFARKSVSENDKNPGRETEILNDGLAQVFGQLKRYAGEQVGGNTGRNEWWHRLWLGLEAETRDYEEKNQSALAIYRNKFEPEIELAAKNLYQHLQDHPATLNSLRAARFSADAAAVALAIKTGGLGPSDLILAPALLSFTSMLAESSVGRYMNRVEQKLKDRQLSLLREIIWTPLEKKLLELPTELNRDFCYAVSDEKLAVAEQALSDFS